MQQRSEESESSGGKRREEEEREGQRAEEEWEGEYNLHGDSEVRQQHSFFHSSLRTRSLKRIVSTSVIEATKWKVFMV